MTTSRIPTLLKYKTLSFFGPSLRGRYGPAPYLALMLLFSLYGFGAGYGIGYLLKTYSPTEAISLLGTAFAAGLSFGFVFSLGTGTLAHTSEVDFVMTAPVRSREWLTSDMLFLFVMILMTGGFAGAVAAIGLVVALQVSLVVALPLLLLAGAFLLLVAMTIQILVILKIRHPKAHIGIITVVLLVLSLIPSISLVSADLPIQFADLPIPQTGFAELAYDIIGSRTPTPEHLLFAFGWLAAIAAFWYSISDTYVFHGIKPTLSGGFGQVNLGAKMAQQRRITSALSGLTTTVKLRTGTGTDAGFLTRFHLIRVWRDGSMLFVVLIIFLSVGPLFFSGGGGQGVAAAQSSLQIMSISTAVLAINWSYYERENLWVVVTAGHSVINYFRGMMFAFAALVIIVAGTVVIVLQYLTGANLTASSLAVPVMSPIFASITAVSVLTRVKIVPSAFSPAVLVVLIVTLIGGIGGGYAAQTLIAATESLGAAVQLVELAAIAIASLILGEALVGSLAKGFRL